MLEIRVDGEAIKQINAACGREGVYHLLESIRIQAENSGKSASTGAKRGPKPKKDATAKLAEEFGFLRATELQLRRNVDYCTYRLAFCSITYCNQNTEENRDYIRELQLLKTHSPQELYETALWLNEQPLFTFKEGLLYFREMLFQSECDENLKPEICKDLLTLKTFREKDIFLDTHPFEAVFEYNNSPDIAEMWGMRVEKLSRSFPYRLEILRSKRSSEHIREVDLLKNLELKLEEVNGYKDQWYNVLTWVNNNAIIITPSGEIVYE